MTNPETPSIFDDVLSFAEFLDDEDLERAEAAEIEELAAAMAGEAIG